MDIRVQASAVKAPVAAVRSNAAAAAPKRDVDVALFRNLPLAGAPTVSAADDPTLVNMDPLNKVLSKLETRGKAFATGVKGYRVATDVVGPAAWGLSAFFNIRLLARALEDPTITPGSKIALTVGTVANTAGAVLATLSSRFVGPLLKISTAGRIVFNKLANIVGGVGGNIFNVINLIETLRNPDATPSQRFFAKLGFVVGILGFALGSVAMFSSLPLVAGFAARLPGLLPFATKAANILGIVGIIPAVGQLFLGKNAWLNRHLKGSAIA